MLCIDRLSSRSMRPGEHILNENDSSSKLPRVERGTFLPLQALVFLKGYPMGHLEGSGRALVLDFLRPDYRSKLRFDRFEAASLAILFSQGGYTAAHSRIRTRISLSFDLPIHLLGTAATLVPPSDERVFVRVDELLASRMKPRSLWWLLHLEGGVDGLATYPNLAGNVGHIDLFCRQIQDLVVQLYPLMVQAQTLFFLALRHPSMPGNRFHL